MKDTKLYIKGLLAFGLTLLLLASSSCTREAEISGSNEVTVNFSLQLPDDAVTRALTTAGENTVQTIDILVFDADKLTYRTYCDGAAISDWNTSAVNKTFTVKLIQGTDLDMMILVNARSIISAAGIALNADKDDVIADLLSTPNGKFGLSSYLPMWGMSEDVDITETTTSLSATPIPVVRMLSRVSIDASAVATTFELTSVHVYNYETKGHLVPDLAAANWNGAKALNPTVPASSNRWGNPALTGTAITPLIYTGTEITGNKCIGEIYLHESKNLDAAGDPIGYLDRTCLVIGGIYGSDTQPTYYRVDFASLSGAVWTYFDLLRNHSYVVEITTVSDSGLYDPDDAFKSVTVNMEVNVTDWTDVNMNHELD